MNKLLRLDARWYVSAVISLGIILSVKSRGKAVITHTVLICIISCGLDFAVNHFLIKKSPRFPLSALVTGLIISSVLPPLIRLFYLSPVIAILSKHIFRIRNKHIFNPAAFGLLTVNLFLGLPLIWWWRMHWIIISGLGLFLAFRVNKLSVIFSFLAGVFIFSGIYSLLSRQPFFANAGIISLFFMFMMLPEPKTSPVYLKGKILFGLAVSLYTVIFMALLPRYDFMVTGLIAGNVLNAFFLRNL